jgi:predicted alpha/beta superfamily hydrolase
VSSERHYPVVYVLDGDTCFGTVLETCRVRGRVGEISEVIVVGIGYPLKTTVAEMSSRRLYDFTTAEWDRSAPRVQELEATLAARGEQLRLGGAPALLELITAEVQPFVHARYRSEPSDEAIFGHSAGGGFVAYCLFTAPAAFTKYIAGSPAFAFNDENAFRLEELYARTHDDLPVTLHLAAATAEAQHLAGSAIVSNAARMTETLQLRAYPSLRLSFELVNGRTHTSVYTEIMQRGLEVCWPGVPYGMSSGREQERLAHARG